MQCKTASTLEFGKGKSPLKSNITTKVGHQLHEDFFPESYSVQEYFIAAFKSGILLPVKELRRKPKDKRDAPRTKTDKDNLVYTLDKA